MANPTKRDLIRTSITIPRDTWLSRNYSEMNEASQEALLRAREHAELLKHRGWWSLSLIGIVLAINAVSMFVILGIGFGWISYKSEFSVPAVIAANFAQTWALTKIAMKFYFHSKKDEDTKG